MLRCDVSLQKEEEQRDEHDNHTKCCSKVTVVCNLTHKLIVQDDRKRPITFTDQHGSTEIGENPHKNKQRGGKNRRQHKRENDARYPLHIVRPKAFSGFVERIVKIFQRTAHIHVYQRKGLQRKYKHNSGKPVYPFKINARQPVQNSGDNPFSPQQLNPCISPDKGGREITQHNGNVQRAAEADFILLGDIGNGQAKSCADQRCHYGDFKRVF